jgi:hypothetical protein
MALHFRHAEPDDLPRCVELVRAWGRLEYPEALLDRLPRFWLPIVQGHHHTLHVLVDDSLAEQPVRGVASGVFVEGDFIAAQIAAPSAGLSRRIIELTLEGRSPLATRASLAAAQGDGGVHAVGVDFALENDNFANPLTLRWLPPMLASARDWLAGWRVQSFHREIAGRDLYALARTAGVPGVRVATQPAGRVGRRTRPRYLIGSTRGQIASRAGSIMWWFFQVEDPQFRFTAGEQDLLELALRGLTDARLAQRLGISPHTVAMRWRSLLERASECRPDLFPPHEPGTPRGAERRSSLLAYLRNHRQELRPHAE